MKKILISLLLVLLFVGAAFTTGQKEAVAAKEELAPFITVYEGSGSVEIAGKVAKFIQEKLGVEIRFTSESHSQGERMVCVLRFSKLAGSG